MDKYVNLFKGIPVAKDKNRLVLRDIPYTEHQFIKDLPNVLKQLEGSEAINLIAMSVTDTQEFSRIGRFIFNKLLNGISITKPIASYTLPGSDRLEIVCDSLTGVNYVVDINSNVLTDIHPNAFWSAYTGKERKEIESGKTRNVARCIFNPRDSRAYYTENELTYLNKYKRPEWYSSTIMPGHPEEFVALLDHLFVRDQKQIDFVLNWIYRLMSSRNETALVLNGVKGVGKNLLYAVCKALTGPVYCAEAPKKFGVKEFNDILRDKILILLDEHEIKKEKYNFLKASFNEWQTIEAKGQAVKSTEKVYTNFMIFHNSPSDIYLENSERRFSVMDITDVKLEEIWSFDKSEMFYKSLEDPSSIVIQEIGSYIIKKCEANKQNPFDLYLGSKYEEILECHVDVLIHSIIDLIEKDDVDFGGYLDGSKINKNCYRLLGSKRATKGRKARSMIREYKFKGEYILGDVCTDTMPWRIKVNPKVIELVNNKGE